MSMRQWITLIEVQETDTEVPLEFNKIDGVSRPAHNSEGNVISPTLDGQIEFWRWFGKSKVVDQHGRPLVVYRGDQIGKSSFTGRENPRNYIQGNIFFTSERGVAKGYSPHRTNSYLSSKDMDESHGLYSMYLKILNPAMIDAKDESWDRIPLSGKLKKSIGSDFIQIDDLALYIQQSTKLDGLIAKDVFDQFGGGDQLVVFSNDQIRLV